jgi:hypothetical protein
MTRREGEREEEDEGVETRTLRRRFTKRITPILSLLTPETIREYFRTRDHEAIWRELNADESHRNRVID